MTEESNLRADLHILKDMYPELKLNVDHESLINNASGEIVGELPFDILMPQKDLMVEYNSRTLSLSKLPGNLLEFRIDADGYPDFQNSIQLNIRSSWMSHSDKKKIYEELHTEFDSLTDPTSDDYDSYTPVLMLIFGFLLDDLAKLLFPEFKRVCESNEEYSLFENILSVLNKEIMNRKNYNCCICMEVKKGKEMIELPCGAHHYLCTGCVHSYYSTMINEGRISNVRCPECKMNEIDLDKFEDYQSMKAALFTPDIPFEFFEDYLSKEDCLKYKRLFYKQVATKLSKHSPYACVTCRRCDNWCVKEDLDDPMIECKNCDFIFCFDCLHSWHGYSNKCGSKVTIPVELLEEYIEDTNDPNSDGGKRKLLETRFGKRALELEVNEYMAEKLLDMAIAEDGSELQRCPKCRCVVQRSEGCNRMKCGVCGTLFCYLCGVSLFVDDCYKHFRDPRCSCYGRLFEGMPGAD
ncbi:hypothetical protein KAFR_0I00350 [Kazachstania africana CBS 2517]|uniref:RBR-type E3 ubiquitin transferase n=1 Tax=Kazachstania africana (strain ATCC 22294 / BCRC 22015 / CBS 2517 / CECT 1963 / NBRC 1671 / NRRL Y-8276) TaxID=1071382 RepID=H2AZL6_KAZAF|nr:hypothetical protein KAFR_0I00350 [Kazachstania africana CBS 2517]CCF59816.1 hypothetical protein KAFR_0I00350 [Kazachstania africana CBS 2517]